MSLYGWLGIFFLIGFSFLFIKNLVSISPSFKILFPMGLGAVLGLYIIYTSSPFLQTLIGNFITR
jgi:hypothetical protein